VLAWGFLAGFLPAAPLAVLAARVRWWWLRMPADAAAFTTFYWAGGLLPGWKELWSG
jgi:hypothetical protein